MVSWGSLNLECNSYCCKNSVHNLVTKSSQGKNNSPKRLRKTHGPYCSLIFDRSSYMQPQTSWLYIIINVNGIYTHKHAQYQAKCCQQSFLKSMHASMFYAVYNFIDCKCDHFILLIKLSDKNFMNRWISV